MKEEQIIFCSTTEVTGLAKNEILPISPVIKCSDGREFFLKDAVRVVKASMRGDGVEMLVDYEHESNENPNSFAAGWIKKIYLTESHIMGDIEWTSKAKGLINNKELRYLSPTLTLDADDNIVRIKNVALVKDPALPLEAKLSANKLSSTSSPAESESELSSERELSEENLKRLNKNIDEDVELACEKHAFPACYRTELSVLRTNLGRDEFLAFANKVSGFGFSHLHKMQTQDIEFGREASKEHREVCALTGVSEEDFKAQLNKDK